jgi:hypothetical protein
MAGKGAAKRHKKIAKKRGPTTPAVGDIKLRSVPEALSTFENIIAAYARGRISRVKFTGLVYGLNSYTNLLRLSLEAEILKRLEKLEEDIGIKQNGA